MASEQSSIAFGKFFFLQNAFPSFFFASASAQPFGCFFASSAFFLASSSSFRFFSSAAFSASYSFCASANSASYPGGAKFAALGPGPPAPPPNIYMFIPVISQKTSPILGSCCIIMINICGFCMHMLIVYMKVGSLKYSAIFGFCMAFISASGPNGLFQPAEKPAPPIFSLSPFAFSSICLHCAFAGSISTPFS